MNSETKPTSLISRLLRWLASLFSEQGRMPRLSSTALAWHTVESWSCPALPSQRLGDTIPSGPPEGCQ